MGYHPWGHKESDMIERFHFTFTLQRTEMSPWSRKWQPTPVLLPGKSHGQRSLVGYCPCGHKELDTTEQLNLHTPRELSVAFGTALP